MPITRPDIMKLWQSKDAGHAIDVAVQSAKTYYDLSLLVDSNFVREVMHTGADYHTSEPSEVAKKRTAQYLLRIWKFHRLRVMAHEASEAADAAFMDHAQRSGITIDESSAFLSFYYPRLTSDDLANAFFNLVPQRRLTRREES